MAIRLEPVDAVTIGVGWSGSILGRELTKAGMKVVGLERGGYRDTIPDFEAPDIHNEYKYASQFELFENLARSTVTHRNNTNEIARPVRYHGPFPWGEGLGGAGVHWWGATWRLTPWDFKLRSQTIERYGERVIPDDCTSQDWPMTYEEMEPFYDKFEYTAGIGGKAGNLNGTVQPGGNPFEGARSRDYPNPPHGQTYKMKLFQAAVDELGYHPFPMPAATMTQPYTNPEGVSMNQCVYCGMCSSFGCEIEAKSSPQTTVLPPLLASENYELRTHAAVTRINLDNSLQRANSVTYIDAMGQEFEQPADIILLTAFTWSNVQLLLVSGIGQPYDPASGRGVVGKNYSWHGSHGATAFFDDGKYFNDFMGAGAMAVSLADFQGDNWDHGSLGFIGGGLISCAQGGNGPIRGQPTPAGTPSWGPDYKKAVAHYFNRALDFNALYDNQSYRGHYLSLDPNYRDAWGNALLRVTFDNMPNELRASDYMADIYERIAQALNPSSYTIYKLPRHFDAGAGYGVVHQVGGAIAGASPETSVVNKYLQSWDYPNVFVVGASSFPQIGAFNPTGTVGALSYWAADAIVNKYAKSPGLLV